MACDLFDRFVAISIVVIFDHLILILTKNGLKHPCIKEIHLFCKNTAAAFSKGDSEKILETI